MSYCLILLKTNKKYCKKNSYKRVDENFSYDSGTNPNFMTIKELKRIVKVYSKIKSF